MQLLGRLPSNLRGDSPDLATTKRHLRDEATGGVIDRARSGGPEAPSTRMVLYRGADLEFRYPENWEIREDVNTITAAPANGIVSGSLAWGMSISTFESTEPLSSATDQLLDELRRANPNMRMVGTEQRMRVDGDFALSMELTNDSPIGGRERNWLVTVQRPDGMLYYFIGAAPQRDFNIYKRVFDEIIASVRFTQF